MNYKELYKESLKNVKNNYFKSLIIVFLYAIFITGGLGITTKNILDLDLNNNETVELINSYDSKTNSDMLDELLEKSEGYKEFEKKFNTKFNSGVFSLVLNETISNRSIVFTTINIVNKFLGGNLSVAIIVLISSIFVFLFKTFVLAVFEIGKNRYFLEQRRYLKTNINSSLYPYKDKRFIRLSLILILKNIYWFLWSFTIIGFFVKYYEYSMISYVLAENPNINAKEAFRLSKELTYGNKLNMFKIDLSIILLKLLGLLTFNLLNIFFTNIYEETIKSELYYIYRKEKYDTLTDKHLLNDNDLFVEEKVEHAYYEKQKNKNILHIDYNRSYSFITYVFFFFTFSFVGWIWEVILHFINDGTFVNRGTMHGPWLPIYGWGGVAIIFLLKRFRNSHFKTFISSFFLCGIIEYFTAWYLETFKHLKYWDYTGYFINIDGRICLEGLLVFGLGGLGFVYIFAPLLDDLYKKINYKVRAIFISILVILFSFDFVYSTFISPNTGEGITDNISYVSTQY